MASADAPKNRLQCQFTEKNAPPTSMVCARREPVSTHYMQQNHKRKVAIKANNVASNTRSGHLYYSDGDVA